MREIFQGLDILLRYSEAGECSADVGMLYAGVDVRPRPDDEARLQELGWSWNETYHCWEIAT